ncbi:MAG TPA: hypothetical protein VJB98_02645 [Candidatus Paceibacterota bacterium]
MKPKYIIFFASVLLFPSFISAASDSFLVSPAHKELYVSAGEVLTFNIAITNQSDTARIFTIGAEDIEVDSVGEIALLSGDKSGYSLSSYLKAPLRSVEIGARQTASVPITIDLPESVILPGLYGAVTVSVAGGADSGLSGAGASLSSRIAVPVLVGTTQNLTSSGKVLAFGVASGDKLLSSGPVALVTTYSNSGDVHSKLSGKLVLKNSLGLTSDERVISSWFVLPDATRSRVDTIGSKFLIGRYSASLSLIDASGEVKGEEVVSFWVIPWKLLLIVLVGVLVIVKIVRIIRKK